MAAEQDSDCGLLSDMVQKSSHHILLAAEKLINLPLREFTIGWARDDNY